MTFALSRGVPEAGVAFALTMMLGVASTLSAVVKPDSRASGRGVLSAVASST